MNLSVKIAVRKYTDKSILRVHYTFENRLYKISTGLIDTRENRKHIERYLIPTIIQKLAQGIDPREKKNVKTTPKVYELLDKIDAKGQSENTQATYAAACNFWKKHLKNVPIDELRPTEILQVVRDSKLSQRTLEVYRCVLAMSCDHALSDELIMQNPANNKIVRAECSKKQENVRVREAYTTDEIRLLLENAQGDLKTALFIVSYTGARPPGEVCGLQWTDIDFENNIVVINKQRYLDGSLGPTKKRDERILPLHPKLKEHLLTLDQNDDFIIKHGRRIDFNRQLRKLRKELNIHSGLGDLYEFRHSFATLLETQGKLSPRARQKMMGHTDLKMTEHYTKVKSIADDDLDLFSKMQF